MTKEYRILGAGPSGLSAAITLAKAGHVVHLHERYDCIGKRFQGDLQGLENWTSKNGVLEEFQTFGVTPNFSKTPFHEVTFTDGKSSFIKRSKEPLFYLVKRGAMPDSLDNALRTQAEAVGVKIHYRSPIPLELADIVATGPIRQAIVAADRGVIFESNLPNMAVGIFADRFAFQGYSYLLVADGYGCLCSVVFNDLSKLNRCFDETVEFAQKNYNIDLSKGKSVGGVGSFSYRHPVNQFNALSVGEAAGFQDFLWGFGIRTAVTSGHLAAKALMEGTAYHITVKKRLTHGFKAGIVTRYVWEKLKWNGKPLLPYFLRFPISVRTAFRWLYKYSLLHRCLFKTAATYLKQQYPNSIVKE